MKNKLKMVPYLLTILLITMACDIGSIGGPVLIFGGDETPNPMAEYFSGTESTIPENDSETASQEPEDKPLEAQDSANINVETVNAGSHEYSVEATNFDCGCKVEGNITPIINFKDDQVIFANADGSGLVYDKIDENTYQRSYMGYYILDSGTGNQVTSTVVEEENRTIIIFNNAGYIMENYSGSSNSPCCYFTNTRIK